MSSAARCARCGASLASAQAACAACLLAPNDTVTLGGMELLEELGRGGMGTVFRARQVKVNREVAVKFLAPEVAHDADVQARFEREAKALAALDHPNIVRLHEFGVDEGESFLVMELVPNGPVSRRVPMSLAAAVAVTREVCDALAYAHAHGIVHRDIKPENVLLDAAGHAKVSDFGIARALRPDTNWTVTAPNVALGSAGFTAPEVMQGAKPDARMDVFSTGALLRALVTGQVPVGEASDLPPRLARVVRKAMAAKPEERFASMTELRNALDDVLEPDSLSTDEQLWIRAVGLVQTGAIASVLWAGLLSLTPRVLEKNDLMPLVAIATEPVGTHQVLTRTRFETGAVLAALFAIAVAFAATALLTRHWRLERLDLPAPETKLRGTGVTLGLGFFTCASYGLRLWAVAHGYVLGEGHASWLAYLPFFGGLLEVAMLYRTVVSVIEARRTSRSLLREPMLIIGQGLALVPPVFEFLRVA